MKWASQFILFAAATLSPSLAFADNCDDLDGNVRWGQLFQVLSTQIETKDNDNALETAEKLNEICSESPILNYAIGRVYRNKGDNAKELYYLQRATRYTEEFMVNADVLEILWFERYEAEHPETRTENKSTRARKEKNIEQLNAEILEATKQRYETQIAAERQTNKQVGIYKAFMWSGVAVGATGVAMGITGGVLMMLNKDDSIDQSKPGKLRVKYIHNVGVGLLSAGVAATVVGAMAAGFGGYLYSKSKSTQESVAFSLSPTGAVLNVTF